MLSCEALSELEEEIVEILPEKITEILTRANRSGELEELLRIMGLSDLLRSDNHYETYKEGKIVVIGGTKVKKNDLLAIANKLGLEKDRFEFCLDYKDIQKYDFKKMQYSPSYRVILFGPTPHSGHGKEERGSIIAEIESSNAYPRAVRLISGKELKITKSNFKDTLTRLLEENYISCR